MSDPIADSVPAEPLLVDNRTAWHKHPLYGAYYGLLEAPFDLTPNPRFLFLTARQREALSNLRYALATSKGFTVIVGEAGTGKTTLVRAALTSLKDTPNCYVVVNNPTLGRREFFELLSRAYHLDPAATTSKARFLEELQKNVEARAEAGGLTGLVIDEAQSMPHQLLEEVRLLGNIETATTKLLNIVLCGQPELADRLNLPSLRQLKQRVALRCELAPFTLAETASYISGRLRIAGGVPADIFTREAILATFEGSSGIPRTINVICDNALITGFAAQAKPVPGSIIEDVCRDFDLGAKAAPDEAPVVPPAPPTREMALPPPPPPKRRFSFFS